MILALHSLATLMLTGLIWFVQIVHYPLMARVGGGGFVAYERAHTRRTTWVVGPLMLAEAATAVGLVARRPQQPWAWTGLGLLAVIWLSTWLVQVPCHRRLEAGFDEAAHRRLVRTNWIRTVAWTARSLIALRLASRPL